MRRKKVNSKETISKRLGGFVTKTLIAGTSLLLASALLQVPEAVTSNGTGFSFVQTTEAAELTQTSGKCGKNVTWSFNKSTGTLTIQGTGAMYNYTDSVSEERSVFDSSENIRKVIVKSGVTSIGDYAFYCCNNLEAVELPSTVTKIGEFSFYCCGSLKTISLPSKLSSLGMYAFQDCVSLTKITIPSSLSVIPQNAFSGTRLKSVTVPGTVKTIGYGAFSDNPELTKLVLENGVESLHHSFFAGTGVTELFLPASVIDTGGWSGGSFANSALLNIKVASDNPVFESRNGLLYSGDELVSVPGGRKGVFQIPNDVKSVSLNCFCGDTNITEVRFPDTDIFVDTAFINCDGIKKISLSRYVTLCEGSFITGCKTCEEIQVDTRNPRYVSIGGVLFSKDKKNLIYYPSGRNATSYTVPEGVTELSMDAFFGAEKLKKLRLPDSLIKLNTRSIEGCNGLESLIIPEKINSIVGDEIGACNSLKHFVFLSKKNISIEWDELCVRDYYGSSTDPVTIHTYPGVKLNGKDPAKFLIDADYFSEYYRWTPLVDGKNVFISPGKTASLGRPGSVSSAGWTDLTYDIKDSSVLKISSAGVVTPLKEGQTTEVYAFAKTAAVHYYATTGFSDVKSTDYYYNSVYWAVDKGITGGVKDSRGVVTKFDPQGVCTRGQMIAFLWRMAGCPEPTKTTAVFTDLDPNAYYYKAVLWGVEKKIVGGYADNTFRPQANCSRSQAVTFLWRYYGSPAPQATTSKFTDVTDKKAYYYNAVLWASENNVTGGYSDGTFRLNGDCSRSQMVTFLYRCRKM